jgi:hypothetical protein
MSEVTSMTGLNPKLDKAIDVLKSCKNSEQLDSCREWYWSTLVKELDEMDRLIYLGAYTLKAREIYGT